VHRVDIADSVLDLIGGTPLVRLGRMAAGLPCPVVVKLESANPGGSVKDRPAVAMIDAAERTGALRPGGTIVEVTSGNTGVGLALVAAQRGYRCVFVATRKVAAEKVALLRAYGADVVVCPVGLDPDDPRSPNATAARLVAEIDGAFRPDQYVNPANPAIHEQTTGPEIWRQTDGRITHLVATAGTGGTISGVAAYLKARDPAIQVVVADPQGSVFSGGTGRPYLVEGAGEDFWPGNYRPALVDRAVEVTDRASFIAARRMAREEGLLVGGSCGTAVHAALVVAATCTPADLVVAILPDSGRGYLSKVHDDGWMAAQGFLDVDIPDDVAADGAAVGRGHVRDARQLPFVHVSPHQRAGAALEALRAAALPCLPVAVADAPLSPTEITGSVHESMLTALEMGATCQLDVYVTDVMAAPLPTVGEGEPLERLSTAWRAAPVAVVLRDGRAVGLCVVEEPA
jgi:cystathionine beta-synthase